MSPRALSHWVVPATLVIIVLLFAVQKHGTARVGLFFGPVTAVYFVTIATLGVVEIAQAPAILSALNPLHAIRFFWNSPLAAFLSLGAVVLAVTGTEALYADMGHFGRSPIRRAWLWFVLPALVLNYYGQGALLLDDPSALKNPFYLLAPSWFLIPLVVLATCATVIASQAVISGTFSLTRAAIQMGYCPRLKIEHTSGASDRADLRAVHQLDAVRRGRAAGGVVPEVGQPRGRVRNRRDPRDADRVDPHLRGHAQAVEMAAVGCALDRRAPQALGLAFSRRIAQVATAAVPLGRRGSHVLTT